MGNTNIANIIKLHKIEKKLFDINGTREGLPEKITSLNEKVDLLSMQNEEFQTKLIDIDKRKVILNGTLSDIEKKINTLNEQMYKVQSNKEYEALLSEIDHLNNENNTYFEELEVSDNNVSNINETLKNNTEKLELQNKKLVSNKKKLDEANSLIEIEEIELEKKRKKLINFLQTEDSLIGTYDSKKVEYSGLAFAEVNRSCCCNCYSSLPPQLIIDTKEQQKLISCPSCSILLYFENENLVEEE